MTSSKVKNERGTAPSAPRSGGAEQARSVSEHSDEFIRRRSELRAVIDAIPDLISVKDREGVYRLCNESFSEYFGITPRLVVGKTDAELFEEEEAYRRSEHDHAVLDREETLRNESWEKSADGQRGLFDTFEAPFYSFEGQLLGLIEVSRDITERHRMEEELRQAHDQRNAQYEQLKELEVLKDSLTHMLVHDMRTPLTGIITSLQLLQMDVGALGEDSEEDMTRALRSATLLAQMINGVLDVNKMEAGEMKLNIRPNDLVKASRAALDSLGAVTTDRDVAVEAEGEVWTDCDETLLKRVVTNLVANALRFTPADGSVRFGVGRSEDGSARVEVRDTGEGIPAEYHERIFEKFGQVAGTEDQVNRSTGLGLTFCKLAVEAHGGRIGVASQVDEGSTFWFELPAQGTGP
ncbi:MAG TPA: PAS domain S-box protein [Gemmatimonadetes bacterium]|nr:PAS domain S-box protein [Gemmatimonadota bacterium]